MNEGVYKSPKWLKKYFDYELTTGDDIAGRREEREKVEAENKATLRRWEDRWNIISNRYPITFSYVLEDFLKKEYEDDFKRIFNNRVFSKDVEKAKKKWIGDFDFLDCLEIFARERQKEIEKENAAKKLKEQIEKELNGLFQRVVNDFSSSPYIDKINTIKEGSGSGAEIALNYTFENGDKLKICGNKITYGGSVYTVGLLWRNKFIGLGNEMIDKSIKRPGFHGKSTSGSAPKSKPSDKHYSHPKGNLYQTLKDTVKQREVQLSKMKKGDPDKAAMENELAAAKRKLKEMKDKYQFEHLNSFEMYNEHYMRNTLLEKEIVVNGVNFSIKYDELKEILYEITDEFTNIEFEIEETVQSGIILSDPNSFMVLLYEKGQHRWPPVLYYLEPKIFDLISNVNDKLGRYNLEVFISDFSSSDDFYEIVITKKGNKPKMNPQRYTQDENGEWKYKS